MLDVPEPDEAIRPLLLLACRAELEDGQLRVGSPELDALRSLGRDLEDRLALLLLARLDLFGVVERIRVGFLAGEEDRTAATRRLQLQLLAARVELLALVAGVLPRQVDDNERLGNRLARLLLLLHLGLDGPGGSGDRGFGRDLAHLNLELLELEGAVTVDDGDTPLLAPLALNARPFLGRVGSDSELAAGIRVLCRLLRLVTRLLLLLVVVGRRLAVGVGLRRARLGVGRTAAGGSECQKGRSREKGLVEAQHPRLSSIPGGTRKRFSISILTFVLAVAGAQPKQPQELPRRRQMRQGSPRSAAC